jgi:RHS repeat-associated protein
MPLFSPPACSEEVLAKGSVTSYAYDDFARLAQTMTPIDGNLNNVVKYTSDPVADLTKQETSIANSSGSITKTYAYDAFGVELSPVASDTNPFRYSGEYFDAETGDYYLRARYYNPRLGRFLTEDPVRDGNNWYVYCNNNPVRYVDPSGKKAVVDDALVTLVLVTGAVVTVTAEWLAFPEGQKALNSGAKIIHDAAQTIVEGVQAGIEAVGEFISDAADAVGEAVDAVGNWLAEAFGGGGSPNPNPKKPNDDDDNHHMIGENGTNTGGSKTLWRNGKTERLDVENTAPGKRPGQIHYHDANNNRYIYDIAKKAFIIEKTKELAPKAIQKLLEDPTILKKIEHGLKILGEL